VAVQGKNHKKSFSLAEITGVIALVLAFLLVFVDFVLAVLPLGLFVVLCLGAVFFPGFGFFLPVISRGKRDARSIALTFDDGPSPVSTPLILDLLARHNLQATFFVIGEKAAQYPGLIGRILAEGHTIGNHSWNHDSFLMLRSERKLRQDIHRTQEILKKFGIQPLVFRPPVGITNSRLGKVLVAEGLLAIMFSCRACDRGNRNVHDLSGKILRRLQPGHIIMLHDLPPYQDNMSGCWQHELAHLFAILEKKFDTVPLEQLIGCPIMRIL